MTYTTRLNRRAVLLAAGATALVACSPSGSSATQLSIKVYKDPSCGCCGAWVDHLKSAGFTVNSEARDDMNDIKEQFGVPSDLTSCHTGVIGGYAIEGHVPADDIKRLVQTKPAGKGLAVAGMPVNSPGMEVAGEQNERYTVWLFQADGKRASFAEHGAS